MLSYRHAFHAGNHADVLKHLILVQLLRYMAQKDKPFLVVDTHAGAGGYSLESDYATKLGEFAGGIGRLWQRKDLPEAVAAYVDLVRRFNRNDRLRFYPGSPWISWQLLRPQDRMRVFELHSTDSPLLAKTLAEGKQQIQITAGDGFAGLRAALPPPSRRGLVLIDPSYELKSDYHDVVQAVQEGLVRFATGTFAIWYPLVAKVEAHRLPEKLAHLPAHRWLNVTLSVHKPANDGFGMAGSGMFIVNPPYTLETTLRETLPWLTQALAQDDRAHFTLEGGENPAPTARKARPDEYSLEEAPPRKAPVGAKPGAPRRPPIHPFAFPGAKTEEGRGPKRPAAPGRSGAKPNTPVASPRPRSKATAPLSTPRKKP